MSREVRRVPANWQHPKDAEDRFIPLLDGFNKRAGRWDIDNIKWQQGLREDFAKPGEWVPIDDKYKGKSYAYWDCERPDPSCYMPDWPSEERTHWQMYENTSQGTPISPVMGSAEALAKWLDENRASAFTDMTASYDEWYRTILGGSAVSAVMVGGEFESGVVAAPTHIRH